MPPTSLEELRSQIAEFFLLIQSLKTAKERG